MKDGQKEHDDRGYLCYWDAEEEGWICQEEEASERFMELLKTLDDFEGFHKGVYDDIFTDDDTVDEDE